MSSFILSGFHLIKTNFVCSTFCILIVINSTIGFLKRKIYLLSTLHPFTINKGSQVYRIFSSGFIHTDVQQMAINLVMLAIFGFELETLLVQNDKGGHLEFAVIFIISLLVSNLITVYLHKGDFFFSSTGASGGVLAVMVSYLFFDPKSTPVHIPLAGGISNIAILAIYLAGTLYLAIRRKHEQVNHEIHLLGCLAGISITLIVHPYLLSRL